MTPEGNGVPGFYEFVKPKSKAMIEKMFGSLRSFIVGALTVAAIGSSFASLSTFQVLEAQQAEKEREIARDAQQIATKAGQDDINRRILRQLEQQSEDLDADEKHIAFLERQVKK